MKKDINKMIEYPEEGILSKEIVKNNKFDVTLFCMAKGKAISEHTSTKQGFIYVLEGKGVFNLMGEKIIIMSGVFIYMNANDLHSLKAEENTAFLLTLT